MKLSNLHASSMDPFRTMSEFMSKYAPIVTKVKQGTDMELSYMIGLYNTKPIENG